MSDGGPRQGRAEAAATAASVAAAAVLYALAALGAREGGLGVVSDDDFARVTIAQAFAASPALDPSGTSWLPAPFWAYGAAMGAFGATLETARATAIAFSAGSGALLYAAGRALGLGRPFALLGALAPLALPLVPVLGAATVPELPAAALTAFALCASASPSARLWPAAGLAALAASLSRYDPWPVALLLALYHLARSRPARGRGARLAAASLSASGPLLWVLWNLHAHGDALRFAHRVAAYGLALGERAAQAGSYPLSIAREAPWLLAAALLPLGIARPGRGTFALPLAGAAAQVIGLSLAAARGGAPTHHPERAVLGCLLVLAVVSAAHLAALAARSSWASRAALAASALLVASAAGWGALRLGPTASGLGPARLVEIEQGRALSRLLPSGERVLLFPDGYGFFAADAALGRPGALGAALPRSIDPRSPYEADPSGSLEAVAAAASRAGARFVLLTAAQRERLGLDGSVGSALPGGVLIDLARLAPGPSRL